MSVIISLLNQAGVDFKDRREEIMICCPFCVDNGRDEDTHFCLGINKAKFVAHCLRCDWSANGLTSMMKQFSRKFHVKFSYREMLKDMKEEYVPPVKIPEPTGLPRGFERFRGTDDEYEMKARRYLKSRRIGRLEIAQYRIGYAAVGEMAGRVIWPVIWDDQIYGYVGRTYIGQRPKYLNAEGIKMLWGAHVKAPAIGLGEGVMDGMAISMAFPGQIAGASTLGCGMDAFQCTQLKTFEKVVMFPDWDEAGITECLAACRRMATEGITPLVVLPERLDGSDPASLGSEALQRLYSAARPWSVTTAFRLRALKRVA